MYSPACSAEVFPPEGDLIGDELAPAQVVENACVGGEVEAQAVGVERLRFDFPPLPLLHISEPTRRTPISYAVFCLKKKNNL